MLFGRTIVPGQRGLSAAVKIRAMTILLRGQQSSIAEQSMSPRVADINRFSYDAVHRVLGSLFEHDLHAKRIDSLCNATIGVLHSVSLAVAAIGHGLAAARGLSTKHAIKPIDRLLPNDGIKVDDILALWVPYVVGARTSVVVAMDWTDGACTRARATPCRQALLRRPAALRRARRGIGRASSR
jgi:hypothetical protein